MEVTKFDQQVAIDLVACSPDGLAAIDSDLKYVAWNSALSKISGVPANEAIGKNVFELFPFLETIGEREIHKKVFEGQTVVADPRPYNVPQKKRTGFFQSHYWPWKNQNGQVIGIFMAIRDVGPSFNRLLYLSELSSALAKATDPKQTLDITLDFLKRSTGAERGMVVMLTDDKKEIEVVASNSAGQSVTIGERLDLSFDIPLTIAIKTNKVMFSPDEIDAQRYSNRLREYVEFTGDVASASVPLIIEGEIIGGIAVSYKKRQVFTEEDASYWTAASNLCAQSYSRAIQFEKERSLRAAAESANKAKSRFVANLSHELRTPLAVIIGHSELMRTSLERLELEAPSPTVSKLKTLVERSFKQGMMLSRILEDVLDLAKIESGTISIKKETIITRDWIEDIAAIAKQLTTGSQVDVKLTYDPSTPNKIGTDGVKAKQILMNLITNAAKFTDKGEIRIETSGKLSDNRKNVFIVRVTDTGVGIEAARQPNIFDAFEKLKMQKTERSGQGLGLTIATQIASALGGSLQLVSSEVNRGSCFELELPDLGLEGVEDAVISKVHIEKQTLKGKKILIAEDDPILLENLSDLLSSAGAKVIRATDGAQAIEFAVEHRPDIAILDLQMPLIDGYEAASQILESLPNLPIIALSAHGARDHIDRAKLSGFKKFLVKPADLNTLAETILKLQP